MAMAARLRSGLPLLRRALNAGNLFAAERSVASMAAVCPIVSKPEVVPRKKELEITSNHPSRLPEDVFLHLNWLLNGFIPLFLWFARSYASSPPANQPKVKTYLLLASSYGSWEISVSTRRVHYCICITWVDSDIVIIIFGHTISETVQNCPLAIIVVVPLKLYGVSGNYATALYIAAVKANVLDKVESELHMLIQASKKSPTFSQFMKDLSVTADTRVKAIKDICAETKFSEITKNFLVSINLFVILPTVVVAESGRLGHLDRIAQRFSELTMAHRGEVKAIVTTVIPLFFTTHLVTPSLLSLGHAKGHDSIHELLCLQPLPPEEEKELKETLQHILGQGTKVIVEQKIDPSILGGLVVEFAQKVFDMSIKTRAAQMERFLRQPINLDGH
ncbi:F1-ATP synthase delta subunit [Striga asiatica]|uniref:F1-ATP synthase delta subunit n=1 Tax=Striga asiatica TaxID=4170 RepID=A0A5A7PZC9_STRAF|nr:F1-ATP synthase delta subunit [Striga asiatica]